MAIHKSVFKSEIALEVNREAKVFKPGMDDIGWPRFDSNIQNDRGPGAGWKK